MMLQENLFDSVKTACLQSLENNLCGQYFSESLFERKFVTLIKQGVRSKTTLVEEIADQIILESPILRPMEEDEDF